MKRIVAFLCVFLSLLFLLSVPVFSHSGGTDSAGGHYDHDTGEYHYHHGYPAHDHPNGVCPYLYSSKSHSSYNYSHDEFEFEWSRIFLSITFGLSLVYDIFKIVRMKNKDKSEKRSFVLSSAFYLLIIVLLFFFVSENAWFLVSSFVVALFPICIPAIFSKAKHSSFFFNLAYGNLLSMFANIFIPFLAGLLSSK